MEMKLQRVAAIMLSLSLTLLSTPVLPALADDSGLPSEVTGSGVPASASSTPSGTASAANSSATGLPPIFEPTPTPIERPAMNSGDIKLEEPVVKPVLSGTSPSTSAPSQTPANTYPGRVASGSNTAEPAKPAAPTKLFGRIEQIAGGNGASFPIVLKAMTPQLDTSLDKPKLSSGASQAAMFSGVLTKSFPSDYRGNWGGELTVWRVEQDPICFKIDPEEASKVLKIFKTGAKGNTNFMFAQDTKGGIVLAPAQVMFSVPGKDVGAEKQMAQMMGGSFAAMGQMGQMMAQMAQNMPVPVIFSFGDIQSNQFAKGLSGNEFVQRTLRNQVRELAPNVLEQQIVAEDNEIMRATGQPRKRYEESVLRFTKVNSQQMYVQAAQVVYGPDRKFQQKIIMYGYMTKGQVANTNPYSGIMPMMQPGSGFPLMQPGQGSGFPLMQPGSGQQLQLPPGFNPLQNLFGQ